MILDLPEFAGENLTHRGLEEVATIWLYNSFRANDDRFVMYEWMSMPAHSCRPSCTFSIQQNKRLVLEADVDLKRGDEITISYLEEGQEAEPLQMRQTILWKRWRFICCCSLCQEQ